MPDFIFNHDGFGILAELANGDGSEQAAADLLVHPLADAGITAIDFGVLTTGYQNCRTRTGRAMDGPAMDRLHADRSATWGERFQALRPIGDVIGHYCAQPRDLLDIVIHHGHARGLRVYASLRLNHGNGRAWLDAVPGPSHFYGMRRDFRDPDFQAYLLALLSDLLEKGVDGICLDFERKAPFFPEEAPAAERLAACTRFLQLARKLTDRPVIIRVAHERDKGERQGQSPADWLAAGLVDAIVPATHNHEPDPLDWPISPFLAQASTSPRRCSVWPQIWPTPVEWNPDGRGRHSPQAIARRSDELLAAGADGVYFFNFCCFRPGYGEGTLDAIAACTAANRR